MQSLQRAHMQPVLRRETKPEASMQGKKGTRKKNTRLDLSRTWGVLVHPYVLTRKVHGVGPSCGRSSGRHTCPGAASEPISVASSFEEPGVVVPCQKSTKPWLVGVRGSPGHVIGPLDEFGAQEQRPVPCFLHAQAQSVRRRRTNASVLSPCLAVTFRAVA